MTIIITIILLSLLLIPCLGFRRVQEPEGVRQVSSRDLHLREVRAGERHGLQVGQRVPVRL